MNQTSKIRLLAAAIACGAVLAALPFAGASAEPGSPVPPEHRTESRVMVIHEDGGELRDEAKLHSRVITRGNKTFVFKTAEPLGDAELERRIAEAERAIPAPPAVPPIPGQRAERRIIVQDGDRTVDVDELRDCGAGKLADLDASSDEQGRRTRVKIKVCGDRAASPAQALEAVRGARASIAANAELPPSVKTEVLGELDAEIAQLERDAG